VAIVRNLRANVFPVFREEVLKWDEDAISDADYAAYFVESKPTIGWYKGWLKMMEITTCVLQPLKHTRAEWNTPENLETYFEVAKDVLLDAGVVVCNPAYDPTVPYTEKILITRPERICYYDETITTRWNWTAPRVVLASGTVQFEIDLMMMEKWS
jgi:hypothetical protein